MTKLFVWDFHGVLEKYNEYAMQEIMNQVLRENGYKREVSIPEVFKWYGLRWADYYQRLVPGLPHEKAMAMHERSVELSYTLTQKHLKPQDRAAETLAEISDSGNANILVSNARPERIRDFASLVQLGEFFEGIFGVGQEHEGNDSFDIVDYKVSKVRDFLRKRPATDIVKIGDSETDIEVGLRLGATTYLFSPRNPEPKTKAHHVISDLRDVLREI